MKIIIIEGPDNTGKNTLINDILEHNEVVKVIHCGKPNLNGNVLMNQYVSFKNLADIAINDFNYSVETYKTEDIIVFNRYHIGEYVYGQIYRNENPNQILEVIKMIEDRILENIPQDDIYYIQLLSTSSELLQRNDDGKSFSDAKLELIEREQQLFKEAFEKSKFRNKHIIYVNKENTNEFKDRQTIINEFNEFTKSDLKQYVKD